MDRDDRIMKDYKHATTAKLGAQLLASRDLAASTPRGFDTKNPHSPARSGRLQPAMRNRADGSASGAVTAVTAVSIRKLYTAGVTG